MNTLNVLTSPPVLLAAFGFIGGKFDEQRGLSTHGIPPLGWAGIGFLLGLVVQGLQAPPTGTTVPSPTPGTGPWIPPWTGTNPGQPGSSV